MIANSSWLVAFPHKIQATTAAVLVLIGAAPSFGGSFSSDFNSGLPSGTTLYGVAAISSTDGITNSGCLKLTTATGGVQGAFVINDLDAGQAVYSFNARFKAYIGGGTGADGFSFNFAPDLPANGNFSEEGGGTGLTVSFDTYANDPAGGGDLAGIDVKANGFAIATLPWTGLRAGAWVEVAIQWHPDGTLDVIYDGFHAHTNLATGIGSIGSGQFGFGSRTGGSTDNHWIDDLSIVTDTRGTAFVDYYFPIGRRARADAPIELVLSDGLDVVAGRMSSVDVTSIVLKLDGAKVIPTVTQTTPAGATLTTVRYQPPALLASDSSHTVSISFNDNSAPPRTITWDYSFSVAPYTALDPALAAPATLVSANPGFALRISQIDANEGNSISRAENQLANLLIDPLTGQPYQNLATVTSFNETGALNYSKAGGQGNFPAELPGSIPGLPGTLGGDTNAAIEAVTYLHLTPGLYSLGVNSSDGFRLTVASTPDVFAPQQAVFNGVRAAADTTSTFAVTAIGDYPFRICYMVGGQEAVNPTTDNPTLEFFSEDALGVRTLINDVSSPGHIAALRPAQTLPYIRSVTPAVDSTGVPHSTGIEVVLVDGSITVDGSSLQLLVNSNAVTPSTTSSGGVTTVRYQPATQFPPDSTNFVQIAFTDSASNRRTNVWRFVAENILTQIWQILPGSSTNATWAKWVTSGSTERGLAYNPKTGHVLLVSRAAGTGADGPNGLGIAILDGNTGLYLGKMNVGDIPTGPGTFKLSMIDVAEDGVIYACNLSSATANFRIYRWQTEADAPALVSDAPTAGGSARCGDDFRVRGSGAGTQIIASGNSAGVTNVPIYTTVDGTNFTATVLAATGLPANSVRLGMAFGCGNTFYGATTATPLQYVGFNGPPSSMATRLSAYDIRDRLTAQDIGPIGVDIVNQRLIGNGTTGTTGNPHTMNLYDLPALTTTGTNSPLDYKLFPSANGNFGTGSIDFTPDGSRVYTLDTGNGIIAFSLAPKLAPPSICAQPQNFIVPDIGGVGFMDVMAIGAPQAYQWRFNGASLGSATNRTLDIYNIQAAQLGRYSVVITNSMGSVTSLVATLDTRMSFTTEPVSQVVAIGASTTLSAAAKGGLTPYSYEWRQYGQTLPATTATLDITGAQQQNAGGYVAVVTDSLGQSITSQVAVVTVGTIGTGTGLTGDYYNLLSFAENLPPDAFYGPPALSRVDSTIDFDWATGSPDAGIGVDYFAARWHGQVQPLYSQPYTFYTTSDDGSQLWVNGQLVVANWFAQPPTERSGSITLSANAKYDILMEYFERGGGAVAKLSWSSPNQVKEIVPASQLYPGSALPIQPVMSSGLSNATNVVLNWSGTFVLESAPEAAGPWTAIATNAGPYTIDTTAATRQFFRLLNRN